MFAQEAVDERGHTLPLAMVVLGWDWHATILHLPGMDHERLTFNFGGRNFRLTNVYGTVVSGIVG